MQLKPLIILTGLAVFIARCQIQTVEPPPLVGSTWLTGPAADQDYRQERALAFERLNIVRQERGLPPVRSDTTAALAVQRYAEALADYIAVTDCRHGDAQGRRAWDWFRSIGGSFNWAGETVACGIVGGAEVIDAWLTSPPHAAILLDAQVEVVELGRWQANNWPVWVALCLKGVPIKPPAPTQAPTPTRTVESPTQTPRPKLVVLVGTLEDERTRLKFEELCRTPNVTCVWK